MPCRTPGIGFWSRGQVEEQGGGEGCSCRRPLSPLPPHLPRQSLRKGRQKSIFPQGSAFQRWKQAQGPVLNEFTPIHRGRSCRRPLSPLLPHLDAMQGSRDRVMVSGVRLRSGGVCRPLLSALLSHLMPCSAQEEKILIKLMTFGHELKASRKGSK